MPFENSGTTPTKNAIGHINFLPIPRGIVLPPGFRFPDSGNTDNSRFLVGPKGAQTLGPLSIPIETLRLVRSNAVHLTIYGWVTYNDIFKDTPLHITMFCLDLPEIPADPASTTPIPVLTWNSCLRHNCGDDECKGEPYGSPTAIWP